MAEKVNIASLTIDIDDVIKESLRLQKQIDGIKGTQKELDRSTEEGAAAFLRYEAQLKNLNKSYRDNQQFASALEAVNQDLTKSMQVEGKSTQELRDSRSQLNQISKNIIGTSEEEIALRDRLNAAIDEQTKALRDQGSEFNSSKDKIGEYTQGINASDLSLQGLITASTAAGGAGAMVKGGMTAAATGMKTLTKSSLAFIATPVGAILAAIVVAFYLVKNAMNMSEKSTNSIKRAFSAFSGIATGLLKFLQPLGDFLVNGLVVYFEAVEKGMYKTLNAIEKGLRFVGLEKAADNMAGFTQGIKDSVQASKELADAELELTKAQRIARKVQLDYQKDAEKLRQIRDNERLSMGERMKANEELGKLLAKQSQEELALAQKALNLANLRIKLEGETADALDKRAEAETEIADIQERITGQTSEQLQNRLSLEKEAADKSKEIKDQQEKEAEEALKKKTEEAKKAAEAAVELAQYELNQYIRANKSKLDNDKFLSDAAAAEEQKRIDAIDAKRREFAAKQLAEGTINQVQYNEAIAAINDENQAARDDIELARKEAKLEQEAIDRENQLAILEETSNNELDIQTRKLEAERQAELSAAEKTGASLELINKKYAAKQKKIDEVNTQERLSAYADMFGGIATLLGENTAAGKAAGIAQATINTYQGITEVWKAPAVLPEPFNTASKVIATGVTLASGLGAVKKITSVSEKFSKGDILKGRSHGQGGIPFSIGGRLGFEAEGGEALINKKSTSMFAPLLSVLNVAGGGKKFASGGIAGTSSGIPASGLIDYDLLASRIAQANASLPAPVVSVAEIDQVRNNVSVVESLATA